MIRRRDRLRRFRLVLDRNVFYGRARLDPIRLLLTVHILLLGYLNGHGSQPRIFADIPQFWG